MLVLHAAGAVIPLKNIEHFIIIGSGGNQVLLEILCHTFSASTEPQQRSVTIQADGFAVLSVVHRPAT